MDVSAEGRPADFPWLIMEGGFGFRITYGAVLWERAIEV